MALIASATLTHLGECVNSAKYMLTHVDTGPRFYAGLIRRGGHAQILRSRDNGQSWHFFRDLGVVDELALRGEWATYRRGYLAGVYSLDEGWDRHRRSYPSMSESGASLSAPSSLVPVPELGCLSLRFAFPSQASPSPRWQRFESVGTHDFIRTHSSRNLDFIWGTGRWGEGQARGIAWYVNPMNESIRHNYLVQFTGFGDPSQHLPLGRTTGTRRSPIAFPSWLRFRPKAWEGLVNADNSWEGVTAVGAYFHSSGFPPMTPAQRGVDQRPRYYPDIRVEDNDRVASQAVMQDMWGAQGRSASMGRVNGYLCVAQMEPGGLISLTWRDGDVWLRKVIAAIPGLSIERMWMPRSQGGRASVAFVGRMRGYPRRSLFFLQDSDPMNVPRRVVINDDGTVEAAAGRPPTVTPEIRRVNYW